MQSTVTASALTAIFAPTLSAAYSNMIATDAGNTIYFQVGTGSATERWLTVRNTSSGQIVESVNSSLADVGFSQLRSEVLRVCGQHLLYGATLFG